MIQQKLKVVENNPPKRDALYITFFHFVSRGLEKMSLAIAGRTAFSRGSSIPPR